MTKTQRDNFFGTGAKKSFGSTPQHERARQIRETQARGQEEIARTRRSLANDPASFANRRAAEAAAQRRNEPAIKVMEQRFCQTGKL